MARIKYMLICSLMVLLAACEKDTEPTNFAPGLTTGNVTDIYRKGATLSGSIHFSGTSTAQSYGILFSELQSMVEFTEHPVKDGSNEFSIDMQNLTPNTTYYYCAYASSGFSLAKGEVKSFTTTESNAPVFAEVTLSQKDVQSCGVSTTVIDDGGSELIMGGFCWSLVSEGEPTIESEVQNTSVKNSLLSATITGLLPETEYCVRAYAVNANGIGYSKSLVVTTDEATTPVLSAITPKDSTDFSVTVEAQVVSSGTSAISKAGFCWSATKESPTVDDSSNDLTTQLTDKNATLSSVLSDLSSSTTYYIRAYATNEQGTSYSEVFTFTTAAAKAPTLSVITEKASSDFSVTVEATVMDAGTSAISKAGFCWSATNETPTVDDSSNDLVSQLVNGNTIFSSALSDLSPSTTYYIRAYATNEQGASYSEVFTFTTAAAKAPTLSVVAEKESSDFSVTVEATVTDAGTTAISKAGFCWSATNEVPTVDDSSNDDQSIDQ